MKISKLILTMLLFCTYTITTIGQEEVKKDKKRIMIGASSSLYSGFSKSKMISDSAGWSGANKYNIAISPEIGFFVAKGLALGISLPIDFSSYGDERKSTSLSILPFIKYYIGSAKAKPYIFTSTGYGFQKNTTNSTDISTGISYKNTNKEQFFNLNLGTGVGIELTENICMDIGVNYNYTRDIFEEDHLSYYTNEPDKLNKFGLNLGFVLMF